MLQIDTEGFDAAILQLFEIPARKPAIVRFEHKHLTLADHERSVELLVRQGYRIYAHGTDTLAYRADANTSCGAGDANAGAKRELSTAVPS